MAVVIKIAKHSILFVALMGHVLGFGQVRVMDVQWHPEHMLPGACVTLSIANEGSGPEMVRIRGSLTDEAGSEVLSFLTYDLRIDAGPSLLGPSALRMQTFQWGATVASRSAAIDKALPSGLYGYCVEVIPASGGVESDRYCDRLEVDVLVFLDLVYPYNRDTIHTVTPSFQWERSGSSRADRSTYRMSLAVIQQDRHGGDAQRALDIGPPTFLLDNVDHPFIPFPAGVPVLQRGSCYAWQIERHEGRRATERTDAWSFCVSDPELPSGNRYLLVDQWSEGAIYMAAGDMLFIRLRKSAAELMISILVPTSEPIYAMAQPDPAAPIGIDGRTDRFMLDLSQLRLRGGVYQAKAIVAEENVSYSFQFEKIR